MRRPLRRLCTVELKTEAAQDAGNEGEGATGNAGEGAAERSSAMQAREGTAERSSASCGDPFVACVPCK